MRDGAAANGAQGFRHRRARRAGGCGDAPEPCLACLKRAEDFARRAVAADASSADGHVWLAAALGLEGRIIGVIRARLANSPGRGQGRTGCGAGGRSRQSLCAGGAGRLEYRDRAGGGAFLARKLYGATRSGGLVAVRPRREAAPGNVAVRYQIALSAGVRWLQATSLDAIHAAASRTNWKRRCSDTPQTAYRKIHLRARAARIAGAAEQELIPEAFADQGACCFRAIRI